MIVSHKFVTFIRKDPHLIPQDDKWLTSKDVREMLSISASSLQNLRISGEIQGTKIGGKWYYEYSEIENLFE